MEIDPKATRILGSTSLFVEYSSPLPLVSGMVCPLYVPFILLIHSWFTPIYAVIVVGAVLFRVDTYVVLLPHILKCSFLVILLLCDAAIQASSTVLRN